jgi:dTDP-4-dehydrorhamnose 3,5-epimerase
MIFKETMLLGAYVLELDKREDDRGFFARAWCAKEFVAHNLTSRVVQTNTSFNKKMGTLRGMHYQIAPHPEAKLVRCIRGSIYDVIIDLRPSSATYKRWFGVELTASNRSTLYVPENFAHGFITLEDDTEILYMVSEFYSPECERGIRYNEPAFGIVWPVMPQVISSKDQAWPDYER